MSVSEFWAMRCPSCLRDDTLNVAARVWTRLEDGYTDMDAPADNSQEWDEDSAVQCEACSFFGLVADCKIKETT